MDILNKIKHTKGSAYLIVLVFDVIAKLLMAIATILIIRMLSIEEYAVYTKFHTIATIAASITGTGLSVAYVRFAAEQVSRGKGNSLKLYGACNLFIIALTVVSLAISPFLTKWLKVSCAVVLTSLVCGGLLSLNKMNQSFFQVEEKFSYSGIATNIKNITLCLFVAVLPFLFSSVYGIHVIWATLLSSLLAFEIGRLWIRKDHDKTKDEGLGNSLFNALMKESGWLIFYFFLVALFDQACVLVMSRISTESAISTYGVASRYYILMLTFLTSLTTVLRIRTSNKRMIDSASNRKVFVYKWIKSVWWLAAIICIIAIMSSKYILPILNGSAYGEVIPTFNILMIGVFISYVFAPNVSVMMAAKRLRDLCLIALLSFVINCLICYMAIPDIGAMGAAIAVVVSNGLLNVTCTIYILTDKREYNDNQN